MQKKAFTLINKGMNRDLSISKAGESSAYTNKNIRIIARDHDTLLSVTNERGTQRITLTGTTAITGDLVGWNTLNEYIILFTHASSGTKPDRIYLVEKSGDTYQNKLLYNGNLGFSLDHPIESVTYYETEDIQKIYWVDGVHVLRMMNFKTDDTFRAQRWSDDYFDTNRGVDYGLSVGIKKDNSGNTRPNGIVQYLVTYYNKYGQETGYVWTSDLVYLSPARNGGSPDGSNNNKITLEISGIETAEIGGVAKPRYTNVRIYSIFRSSYKGQAVGYVVADFDTESATNGKITVVDDGAHLEAIDVTKLLFLGSKDARIGTLTYKEQTLFLGNIQLNQDGNSIESAIRNSMFVLHNSTLGFQDGIDWEAKTSASGSAGIEFIYSSGDTGSIKSIPISDSDEVYSYTMQLSGSSSEITGFKGGEKYRFGLRFRKSSGEDSEVFWIGDKVNHLYPVIDNSNSCINRIVVKCVIAASVVQAATGAGYSIVQLMFAEATYADRSVKAQGVINPTVFNVWNRYKGRIYAMPTWTSRPRNSEFAWKHFDVIHNTGDSTAEIECNYWETEREPIPYYQLQDYGTENERYSDEESGKTEYNYGMLLYRIRNISPIYELSACGVLVKTKYGAIEPIRDFTFQTDHFPANASSRKTTTITNGSIETRTTQVFSCTASTLQGTFANLNNEIKKIMPELMQNMMGEDTFAVLVSNLYVATGFWSVNFTDPTSDRKDSYQAAANWSPSGNLAERWIQLTEASGSDSVGYNPSYNKKHLMFVDENVVTLDSPEITYEASLMDNVEGYKLRIVGVAPVTGRISDVYVDATRGDFVGENLANDKYSGTASNEDKTGILSWPLWREHGLQRKSEDIINDVKRRTSSYYYKASNVVNYWLYMWSKSDIIDGFTDEDVTVFDGDAYSRIKRKIFGNLRFAKETRYNQTWDNMWVSGDAQIRLFNYTHSQYIGLDIDDASVYYDGFIDDVLTVPANFKYPIWFSAGAYDKDSISNGSTSVSLYSASPVRISYASNPHLVLALPSVFDEENKKYSQQILPYFDLADYPAFPQKSSTSTGALIPWIKQDENIVNIYWTGSSPTVAGRVDDKISLYGYFEEGSASDFVTNFWNVAKANYPGIPLYLWVNSNSDSYPGKFLVDITSGTERIEPDWNNPGYINYTLSYAQIKAEYISGEQEEIYVDAVKFVDADTAPVEEGTKLLRLFTGVRISVSEENYPYTDYGLSGTDNRLNFNFGSYTFDKTQPYFLIGEVFYDYDNLPAQNDTRYGGITKSAIEGCKFIPAGPLYKMASSAALTVYGNEGDTYFQRWDDLRIKPIPGDSPNNVTDIVSVMLETHINLDGRYDNQRGTRYLASLDTEHFGQVNRVYSQPDDFFSGRDLDRDYDVNTYRSSVTWTLEKHDAETTDEWTHITLASSLKLDGDKGPCNALRRYQNGIIAFQDRSISEILFNSRTQIPTGDGVPIEIANSGKVDGKRVITNNSGCINKWSIIEGKNALYYVDNINKAFYALSGNLENLSEKLGFTAWFKEHNKMDSWKPGNPFNNFVSYFDRIHSDVYLVGGWDVDEPCLVYNETLGVFTSFFDYANVPMMTNVGDEFISFYGNYLYKQNRGKYNDFFGTYKPFSAMYRVTPDPYGDKIWSNIEYRADFYDVNPTAGNEIKESGLIDGGDGDYKKDSTFDSITVWNEYQTTGAFTGKADLFNDGRLNKRFRIWRCQIPRAYGSQYGLDRIRNPWVNVEFKKTVPASSGQAQYGEELMQLHDATIIYYE